MLWATRDSGESSSSHGHPSLGPCSTPPGSSSLRNPRSQTTLETADDWDELITALKKGFGEPTLIFVLALHGGSDAGGAYLMPNRMKRPEDRLDMRKLIASMNELPAEKTKILVVEGAQVESDWRLGMLHNDFARRLKELEPEILSRAQPLGPQWLRRRSAVLGFRRTGTDDLPALHHRGAAGR